MARILVAEDESGIRTVLSIILQDMGHQVVEASDGQAALSILEAGPPPDLVLLDLFMPGMNGKEISVRMSTCPRLREVPVIIITGAVLTDDALPPSDTYQALITKPFELADVRKTVEELLVTHPARDSLASSSAEVSSGNCT